MRQMITGLAAAIVVVAASAAPAMACGGLLGYDNPCAPAYTAPVYSNCNCGGGWGNERLPDPVQQYGAQPYSAQQYYYVDQGPTYTGPGDFAPRSTYREGGYEAYRHHPYYYGYHAHHYRPHYGYGYGYQPHYGYMPHHSMHYGYYGEQHHYGYREHVLRRYY